MMANRAKKVKINKKIVNVDHLFTEPCIFIYTFSIGLDGEIYGSRKNIRKANLEGREFEIVDIDGRPAIKYTDGAYNPDKNTFERFNK